MENNNDESMIMNSKVAQSFTSLIKKYNQKDILPTNTSLDFNKELFCDEECYAKFLNVIEKIKKNQIPLEKIVLPQDSSKEDSNFLSKVLTYYYQVGYWMKSQESP